MSQASDFNVVINISHAPHAAPTQWSGKKLIEELHQQETAQFFSSNCSQCLKHQTSMWLSTSAMHLMLLQLSGLARN
uniref:Uncharacterized protein n=1 Tax=Oryza barthii TaxID=65489 RepID=A0A0D3HKC0_9ORYZ